MERALALGKQQQGFTYLALLIAVLMMGIWAQVTSRLMSTESQREKEQELLFRGTAYVAAIRSYYFDSPYNKQYPHTLDDLLNDPRFPNKHHLRRLYPDPMSEQGWTLVKDASGGIVGVASSSQAPPIKQSGFAPDWVGFEQAEHYSEWVFAVQH